MIYWMIMNAIYLQTDENPSYLLIQIVDDIGVFFYVDSANRLAEKVGGEITVLSEEKYYRHIDKHELKTGTKLSMWFSDRLKMVKMVNLQLS